MRKIQIVFLSLGMLLIAGLSRASAQVQDITMEAKATWIVEERQIEIAGKKQLYQKIKFLITSGPEKGKTIEIENGSLPQTVVQHYQIGNQVVLGKSVSNTGTALYYIVDQVRRPSLYVLAALFVAAILLVARMKALQALVALVLSFGVIFLVVIPQILKGHDPVFIALITSLLILPISFYLSHGFNRKTNIAIIGTLSALIVTSVLAKIWVSASQLTGYASEEAMFVQTIQNNQINIQGLLLAGIIIGLLGMLDDVTISQASVVEEIYKSNRNLSKWELFSKAMNVGKDHIASMINTLVLVYAGASMPLLLLFTNTPKPFTEMINYEMVAEEIVRTLVGSIGIVLAVPFTTWLAVLWLKRK